MMVAVRQMLLFSSSCSLKWLSTFRALFDDHDDLDKKLKFLMSVAA